MKVLMLNTFDETGGAARAALRLQKGMRRVGEDSTLLVQFKTGDAPDVLCSDTPAAKAARSLRLYLGLLPVRRYRNRPENNFSPARLPDGVSAKIAAIDPDIVHLHWVAAGFVQVETLRRIKKPLVWTLHDSWAFTGGCHVPFRCEKYRQRCGACPVLGSSRENDLSRRTWKRKARAWRDLNLTVVAPSRWLAGCARSSSLFCGTRIEIIPNGVDPAVFKPTEKRIAREILRLPQDRKLILFGAVGGLRDPNKGFHLLAPALARLSTEGLKDPADLVVFGSSEPSTAPAFGMKVHYLGRFHDDVALALLYAAADVFVAPSLLENLPNTVLEAMACGTPCVGFAQGGMGDLIVHGTTGFLAEPFEPDDLARWLRRILEDDGVRKEMARHARKKVEEEFSLEAISRRYAALYREILRHPPQQERSA